MGTGTFYIFTDFLIDFLFIRRICRPIRVAKAAHSPLPAIPYSVLAVVQFVCAGSAYVAIESRGQCIVCICIANMLPYSNLALPCPGRVSWLAKHLAFALKIVLLAARESSFCRAANCERENPTNFHTRPHSILVVKTNVVYGEGPARFSYNWKRQNLAVKNIILTDKIWDIAYLG